jgi:type IV secretory pathway VirB4 component
MANAKAHTQRFVQVRDIRGNVVIQKDGKLTSVLLASSINFALKSFDEQQAVLQQFQNFLNTIDFSLQIYMQSRRLNINPYLDVLKKLEDKQDNDLMRIQLREYMSFIQSFTSEVDVMSKNFFVAVSYTPGINKDVTTLFNINTKRKQTTIDDTKFEQQRTQLEQRMSLVIDGLSRVGVRTVSLGKDELVELFYHTYNPGDPTGSAPVTDNI